MKLRVPQILSARRSMFNPFSADMGTKSPPICFFAAARYCSFTKSTLLKTTREETYLLSRLKHVQDQQYEVRVPGNRENSPSPPASRRRAANDSWKVENLDVRSVETQNPRNNSEGCEGICRNFRLSIRQPIQNSRLANTGEADENDCRVATLRNLEGGHSSLR